MFRALKPRVILGSAAAALNRIRPVYATMAVTQNELNTVTVTAAADATLPPPAAPVPVGSGPFNGYVKVTGYAEERTKEMTVADSEITVQNDGVFIASVGWATFKHSQNSAVAGFVFAFERGGNLIFSQRPTVGRVPNIDDPGTVSGGGTFEALEGDKLSVWVASDKTGTITIPNSNISVHMLEDTSE